MTRQVLAITKAGILIVEDEAVVALDLARRLTALGYPVLATATSGKQAVAQATQVHPDLVLMDIRLSGHMDGIEAADVIRETLDVPVVYLTAFADDETLRRAKATLPFGYVLKPFEEQELQAAIEMALQRHRLDVALRESERRLCLYAERLQTLHEIDRAILAAESPEAIARATLQRIRQLVPCQRASVTLFDRKADLVSVLAARVNGETYLENGQGVPLSTFHGIRVLEQGQHYSVEDISALGKRSPGEEQLLVEGIHSYISLPLINDGKLYGSLNVGSAQPDAFDEQDIEIVKEAATSLAIATHQARLRAETNRCAIELETRREDLEAFAHTVAHDLQDTLGIIVGYSAVLRKSHASLPAEDLRLYLDTIVQSGQKMAKIIRELLLLAEVREDKVMTMPLDMASIVAEAQERLTPVIEERGARIHVPKVWPSAQGYGPWIEEVWYNYISNAVKYGGEPPHVELGATCESDGRVSFWVRDNGNGIASEHQDRLFTPFAQINRVRLIGHGLGLSIVRRIVDKLGGQVGIQSEPGQGSVFSFTLPGATDEMRTTAALLD